MAYSRWSDVAGFNCFWYTSPETGGAEFIDQAKLIINPKNGERQSFTYLELKVALDSDTLNEYWVADRFPDAPVRHYPDLLRFIHVFLDDMEHSVFRYRGYRQPTAGVIYDEHRPYDRVQLVATKLLKGR